MTYFIYNILTYISIPFAFARLYLRGKKAPDYRKRWGERLGYVPFKLEGCIWVHAVSLGESIAANGMIKNLIKSHPNKTILITTTTPTGSAYITKTFGDQVKHCYFPYDTPGAIQRFIQRTRPDALVIMETELWPNILRYCRECHIPALLANARLSARSAKGYARFGKVSNDMLNSFQIIACQNKEDGQRYLDLGLAPEKLHITGSIKFDLNIADDIEQRAAELKDMWKDRPVWIAGSTHQGEDEHVLAAHKQILKQHNNAILILVPRHPERFKTVAEDAQKQGFNIVTRSSKAACTAETNVFIGDTMGEMMLFYAASDIAFVGGSFVEVGGHNLLEPAALAKPGLTGPIYFNFKEITTMLIQANAVAKVDDSNALAQKVSELMSNPDQAKAMGENGLTIVKQNRGALKKLCDLIDNIVPR